MIAWPESLIAEIAERRCIAFLGAGVSHFSESQDGKTHPPLWPKFLEDLKAKVRETADKNFVSQFIENEQYLEAAEIMRAGVSDADFNCFLVEEFTTPAYKPANIHNHIRDLDLKVVITTNFDTIYEDCCRRGDAQQSYNVLRYHDDNIVDDLKSTRRLIIKAHGCVSNQKKAVLARSDYFTARRDHPGFFSVLDALFCTNTLLFLGYGLGDPDIHLVLENVAIKTPSVCPHYALIQKGSHPALKAAMAKAFNIDFLEHEKDRFDEVESALKDLAASVCRYREIHP